MLNIRLALLLLLSSLYISFSEAQTVPLPPCAASCPETASSQAGCDPTGATCTCSSTYLEAAGVCADESCGPADAATAREYFNSLCTTTTSSGTGSPSSVSSPSDTGLTGTSSGTIPATGTTTTRPATTGTVGPTTVARTNTSPTTSPTSNSSTSNTSRTTSSTSPPSGNAAAAAMPTHAAALLVGGIGAIVAAVV
ncbi:hypothetical protein BC826DRAFT_663425 [Russula brevipes]|nr:hypothetical protein BC826DRAFT_663425 [Russula brevipes]